MDIFLQQLINGITIGSFYALIALGYTMVYGVLKLINFAHGDLFMTGSYLGLTIISMLIGAGLGNQTILWTLAGIFIVVMALVAGLGVGIERVAYRPLRRAGRLAPLVSALGVSIALQNAVMLVYGPRYRVYPRGIIPAIYWQIGGFQISFLQVFILLISLILMVLLYYFIHYTRLGTAVRATALDHDVARLMGIDVDTIVRLIFIIGPALGAAGGIMVGLYYGRINFTLGWGYGLKAFTAAILGGIGNIPGAMLGGMLLGIFETLVAGFIPQGGAWKEAIVFLILILILIVRPRGILGERVAEKL